MGWWAVSHSASQSTDTPLPSPLAARTLTYDSASTNQMFLPRSFYFWERGILMSGELEIIFKAVVSRVRSGVRWQQPLTWASAVTGVTDVCLLCLSKFSLCFFFASPGSCLLFHPGSPTFLSILWALNTLPEHHFSVEVSPSWSLLFVTKNPPWLWSCQLQSSLSQSLAAAFTGDEGPH